MSEQQFTDAPLCPFCSQPIKEFFLEVEDGSSGCESCGLGSADVVFEIKCDSCKRVVYRKEGKSYDF